jgi:hypothetical protein
MSISGLHRYVPTPTQSHAARNIRRQHCQGGAELPSDAEPATVVQNGECGAGVSCASARSLRLSTHGDA